MIALSTHLVSYVNIFPNWNVILIVYQEKAHTYSLWYKIFEQSQDSSR